MSALVSVLLACASVVAEDASILDRLPVRKGVCLIVGNGGGELAVQVAEQTELIVYYQTEDAADAQRSSAIAEGKGLYGSGVYVGRGIFTRLHPAANLVDVAVVLGVDNVPRSELLRVLRPGGKALFEDRELVKPSDAGADDWTHPYYGPNNNMFSKDRLIRAPYLPQFLAEPHYAPGPQAYVSSAGRLFCAFGHSAFHTRANPYLNTLLCVNAYNGTHLWTRKLPEGFMVDRNTMVATAETLYLADHKSCKMIDPATGELKGEIVIDAEFTGGTFWKWMAVAGDTMYAMIGEDEGLDQTKQGGRGAHGWAWDNISKGFNRPQYAWGMGRTIVAVDLNTKKVKWHHRENRPADSRAVCLDKNRLYLFSPPDERPTPGEQGPSPYLVCLDAGSGKQLWRIEPSELEDVQETDLFKAIGPLAGKAGSPNAGWNSARYLRCVNDVLYFAGPPIKSLVAVSAVDGSLLWTKKDHFAYQIVVHDDAVYAFAGQGDGKTKWALTAGSIFHPRTGEELGVLPGRRACVPATSTLDSVFVRAFGGTMRFDTKAREQDFINSIRPSCFGGVIAASGHLFWAPWQCDCSLMYFGLVGQASAGAIQIGSDAASDERLDVQVEDLEDIAEFSMSEKDWTTLRANNQRNAKTSAKVSENTRLVWEWKPANAMQPTAPVTVNGLVIFSGSDGVVRALDSQTGESRWKAYTGGGVNYPPTLWNGRAYVSSNDGWIYTFEAASGRLIWRFRAAPEERRILVYDKVASTWPVASGVLIQDGVAYFAAGMFDSAGTHVYALDAVTGQIRWQNNSSGDFRGGPDGARVNVSVQGHLLADKGRLYLAGGAMVPTAIYDMADGKLLNKPRKSRPGMYGWGASELYLTDRGVHTTGKRLYQHPDYIAYKNGWGGDVWNMPGFSIPLEGDRKVAAFGGIRATHIACIEGINAYRPADIRRGNDKGIIWEQRCDFAALAVCENAVVATTSTPRFTSNVKEASVAAYNMKTGDTMWEHSLPAAPLRWGLAVDREGGAVVALQNGQILCFRSLE